MFGFQGATLLSVVQDPLTAVPLSATQSGATIYHGTNQLLPEQLVENSNMAKATGNDINPNIDNAEYAFTASPVDVLGTNVGPLSLSCDTTRFAIGSPTVEGEYLTLDPATDQIKTSSTPVFLSCSDINMTRTRGLSHALFTNISWQFERENWQPYFGLGAAFEIAKTSCRNCCDSSMCCVSCCDNRCTPGSNSCCNSCIDCAVSQWGVWMKGGIAFS